MFAKLISPSKDFIFRSAGPSWPQALFSRRGAEETSTDAPLIRPGRCCPARWLKWNYGLNLSNESVRVLSGQHDLSNTAWVLQTHGCGRVSLEFGARIEDGK